MQKLIKIVSIAILNILQLKILFGMHAVIVMIANGYLAIAS